MKVSKKISTLFVVTVLIPTVLGIFYYGFYASDIYISESTFVVKSSQKSDGISIGDMLKGSMAAPDDGSFVVQSYILSRDALVTLEKEMNLVRSYSSSAVDFVSRFPGLYFNDSFENFYIYYQDKISNVEVGSDSGIVTLKTRAYTPEEAHRINERLLEMSEDLVNRLNERSRQDMIQFAGKEVEEAEKKARIAETSLAQYRNESGMLDPEREAVLPLKEIGKLRENLNQIASQISILEGLASDNPQLPTLRRQKNLIEKQIKAETTRIAGQGDLSLASKTVEYTRLMLEKEFADKMLATALAALAEARTEAHRKQEYIERISQPNKPDRAMQPRRLRSILGVVLIGLMAWGVFGMLIASVKEHQD